MVDSIIQNNVHAQRPVYVIRPGVQGFLGGLTNLILKSTNISFFFFSYN